MSASTGLDLGARHLLITARLRQRRDDLGLTQKQVVSRLGRCGLITTNRALSSLEHGTGLDVAKLPELATALDCTVTYLVGLTADPHRWEPDGPIGPSVQRRAAAPAATVEPPTGSKINGHRRSKGAASLILGAEVPDRQLGTRR
ncbi:MAG: helix-turn-helix domain-containing protein [Trebonia sp.]